MVTHYSVNMDGVLKRIMRNPTTSTASKVAGAHEFIGFLFHILTLAALGDFYAFCADEVIPAKYQGGMDGLRKIDLVNPYHVSLVDAFNSSQRAAVMLRRESDFVDAIGIEVTFIGGTKRLAYYFAWNGEKTFFAGWKDEAKRNS